MKWLVAFLFLFTATQADVVTTDNLLPNAGDGQFQIMRSHYIHRLYRSFRLNFAHTSTKCTERLWRAAQDMSASESRLQLSSRALKK